MQKNIQLHLAKSTSSRSIDDFLELLESIGVEAFLVENENFTSLAVRYDEATFYKRQTRNAGRNPKKLKREVFYSEIKDMQRTMSAEMIAKELGISRATYFRILKSVREIASDDYDPIFEQDSF